MDMKAYAKFQNSRLKIATCIVLKTTILTEKQRSSAPNYAICVIIERNRDFMHIKTCQVSKL